ncbi:MAG TPA: ATP-binding protein [Terriglobales bacterium]|jgi:nitrogen fixation/metabolism regulation signal transduction histidine kinase|nr:ATP-binding protein [Terriglobales bacterium]
MASPERLSRAPRLLRYQLSHENRVFLLAVCSGAVPAFIAFALLWDSTFSAPVRWTVSLLIVVFWIGFAASVRSTVARPLRTIASMQAAVREGDFSIRARSTGVNDSLSELMFEVNELSSTLQDQRRGAFEAGALMRKVLSEIDVAVFAFDAGHRLRLLNRAAERLLGRVSERAIGSTAEKLGIHDLLEGEEAHTIERNFPGGSGRWGVRRSSFRQSGVPHDLVVVTDLSRALREEERQAWQRLVRVLGHELNNSLAPIKSISQSLQSLFGRVPRPPDWEDDVTRGLAVIADRSEALARFIGDYSRLARLPKPNLQQVSIRPLLRRIAALDTRALVNVIDGPEVLIEGDRDQLEQLFINVLRNAIEASAETGGTVSLEWNVTPESLYVSIIDEGRGIGNPANLFVPFFTTKKGGSGIGLALCRQITEAHGGHIALENRRDKCGCQALIELPLNVRGNS